MHFKVILLNLRSCFVSLEVWCLKCWTLTRGKATSQWYSIPRNQVCVCVCQLCLLVFSHVGKLFPLSLSCCLFWFTAPLFDSSGQLEGTKRDSSYLCWVTRSNNPPTLNPYPSLELIRANDRWFTFLQYSSVVIMSVACAVEHTPGIHLLHDDKRLAGILVTLRCQAD